MSTWKRHSEDGPLFYHLCGACHAREAEALQRAGWVMIRAGEPVACNNCTRSCGLTSAGLWGADEACRLAVCQQCPQLDSCPLKGRYYC